ncbi:collagenase [Leptospira perolatii]|uniref:microbial collagenase n=2 Tax=Leptospira perolatii TaxID=2023191 RepID=A0A2M9ZQN6_9LEPT|nr:collagenase [Leptospira perolatii]PJZ70508.1 collagenase [Leptospira perolatii]PJZ74345.1 collagenase [Leptospira perolatii]
MKNHIDRMVLIFSVFLIFFLGCSREDDRLQKNRSWWETVFGTTNEYRVKSVTRSAASFHEPIGFRKAGAEIENHLDFDGKFSVKKRIIVPSVQFFGSISKQSMNSARIAECTGSYVSNLQPGEFVTFLQTHDLDCLDEFLWDYNQDSNAIYSQANMIAVINRFSSIAPLYNGTNDLSFLQLFRIFWAGFYLKAYYTSLPFDEDQISQALISPMQTFAGTSNFLDAGDISGEILNSFFITANNAKIGGPAYSSILSFLEITLNHPERVTNSYWQSNALSAIFNLISRQTHPSFPSFRAAIDASLIDKLRRMALITNFLTDSEVWILNNAIFDLTMIDYYLSTWRPAVASALTEVLVAYPYLSEPYLWAVKGVTQRSDCAQLEIGEICLSVTKNAVRAKAFTNHYSFDDGTQVVHTPLTLPDIQPLYHALKQVESQFFRLVGVHAPIPSDPTDSIAMYVYGTLKDYQVYHPFLFNLPTNNGGIYIEQDKAFYTYQRTPSESIYTLEELLRHEYVHYLVGRFLVQGMWSEDPIYTDQRMTWFDEGIAEFLAGGTTKEIIPRKVLVSQIETDESDRMDVSEIVRARYGDFKFYRYSGNFFHYLFTYRKDTLRNFLIALRDHNIPAFDSLVAQISGDASLNASYQSYLDSLVSRVDSLTDPLTLAPDLTNLSTNDTASIESAFRSKPEAGTAKCTISAFGINGRFSCRGTTTGTLRSSSDWVAGWTELNSRLNQIISSLQSEGINNFASMNCRLGEIRMYKYSDQFYPSALYSCEGPIPSRDPISYSHPEQEQADFKDTRQGFGSTCSLISAPNVSVQCNTWISTILFPNTTTYEEMYPYLNGEFVDLKSEVFTMRPPFYKRITCDLHSIQTVIMPNGEKYLVGNSTCNL